MQPPKPRIPLNSDKKLKTLLTHHTPSPLQKKYKEHYGQFGGKTANINLHSLQNPTQLNKSYQVRFEKLLESIRPTIIVTQDESDAYITITYLIDDEIIQDLEFLLEKGVKVRAEDIASVQEDLEEHIKNHIAETAQDVMHYIHPSGYIISYYNDSHEPPHTDPQNTESHSPTTEQDLDFDYDKWIDEHKEKLQKILSLLQHFHKNSK